MDAIVIGAGQAGLAMGYYLAQSGKNFLILDGAPEVGQAWRSRWDSLVLFTPSQFDGLPGLPFPAASDTYPTKDEVADYLAIYAKTFELPVTTNSPVMSVSRSPAGYVVRTPSDTHEASVVVVATGPFQQPVIPSVSADLDPTVHQVHSADYRNPEVLPGPRVLVVGGGNSGCQIAEDLAPTRRVELAIGQEQSVLPQRLLGRDIWWWGTKLRIDRVTVDSRLGQKLRKRDPVIGTGPKDVARRYGVPIRQRVTGAAGRRVTFVDSQSTEIDTVVWATGYRTDHSWVDVPEAKDSRQVLIHRRGVTPSPGLYALGLTWLYRRGSALLGWVWEDAEYLAGRMSRDFAAGANRGA
jgi:putative flavoprotein involved in K+ transport